MRRKNIIILLLCLVTFIFINNIAYSGELYNIKKSIKAHKAKWVAGNTSVSRLSPEKRKLRLGLLPPKLTEEEKSFATKDIKTLKETALSITLPSSLDWRANNGNFITPIKDQGNCGSCWAFATVGVLESATLIADETPGMNLDLSEQILVSCSGAGDCGGGRIDLASNFLQSTGTSFESCYPYTATNGWCGNACANWQLSAYKITNWFWVTLDTPNLNDIKTALYLYGPLVSTMEVYSDFFYYQSGIYSHSYGLYAGGHAIIIVGYNDEGGYFIAKNSWGTGWGESGYFKIAYSQLSNEVKFGAYTIAYIGAPNTIVTNLKVIAPNGEEAWTKGTTKLIKWSFYGNIGSYVKIELLKGGSFYQIISSLAPAGTSGVGSYNWNIPTSLPAGSDYSIRITSTSNPTITDTSDSYFAITNPSITVIAPATGEVLTAGSSKVIKWIFEGNIGSYVKIELYKGGVLNRTISTYANAGTGGSGSYTWTIPSTQTSGNDYTIKVTSTSNSLYYDYSDVFTINGAPPSTLTVIAPNGGENILAGATYQIRWTYTGNPGSYVKIELLKNGVLNRTITSYGSIGSGGNGYYNWTVPSNQTPGNDYKIRITSTSNASITDVSNDSFNILGPTLTVILPNGGETWLAGKTYQIRWSYTGNPGSYVRIELLKGGVLNRTITSYGSIGSGGSGYYNWTVPYTMTKGSDYKIRITSTSNSLVNDTSDGDFSIQ